MSQTLTVPAGRQAGLGRWYWWRRHALVIIGGTLVLLLVISALFAPQLAPYDPYHVDVSRMLLAPSGEHLLGTDEVGRDVLSRVIFAARVSVQVASVAVSVGLLGGAIIGITAAYVGGWVDGVLMRFMELLFSFPAILLAIVLMASLGTNLLNAMAAIGIIFIPGFSRLARAATQQVLRQQYIEVARTLGMGDGRIILREILPNVVTPLLVEAMAAFAYAVILESSLSFLGLGAQPPQPSWGNMLSTGRGFMAQASWLGIVPGLAIFLGVLGFTLVGDGLRDLLDPRLKD
ncbi:MAG: ABC transporter permease [Caldilineaceae bacterium]|nr:ABC transporter permease [Caldilineaceae bacterium]